MLDSSRTPLNINCDGPKYPLQFVLFACATLQALSPILAVLSKFRNAVRQAANKNQELLNLCDEARAELVDCGVQVRAVATLLLLNQKCSESNQSAPKKIINAFCVCLKKKGKSAQRFF